SALALLPQLHHHLGEHVLSAPRPSSRLRPRRRGSGEPVRCKRSRVEEDAFCPLCLRGGGREFLYWFQPFWRPTFRPAAQVGFTSCTLFRVLAPPLVFGRLLPSLVGSTGADQIHGGAEVAAVLPRPMAGTVSLEAEVRCGDSFELGQGPGPEIAAPVADLAP